MRKLQAKIIEEMGVQPRIDPAEEVRRRVTFLKEYLKATHTKGFVLGISGGLDSSLAGRLAQLAVEELEGEGVEASFVAVRLPYGTQHDEDDAQAALDFIQAKTEWTFNISAGVDGVEDEFEKTTGAAISDFHKGNTKARIRMLAQYALAGEHNYLVIGTDHGAESVTGFFTKFGDGGADILPLFGLAGRVGCPRTDLGKGPDGGPAGRPARPHRRGRARPDLRPDRRLPRGPRGSRRRRETHRGQVPAHAPQADRPGHHLRQLVEVTVSPRRDRQSLARLPAVHP